MYSKNKLFLFFWISFLFWIWLNALIPNIQNSLQVLLIIGVLFFAYYFFFRKYFLYLFIALIWCFIGIFLINSHILKLNQNMANYEYIFNNKHLFEWNIIDLYKKKEHSQEFILKVQKINEKIIWDDIYILIDIPNFYTIWKWYNIKTNIKTYTFKNSSQFKYKEFMLSKKIYWKAYINNLEIWEIESQNYFLEQISIFRTNVLEIIHIIYPKNEALFLGGILLWAREEIPQNLKNDFNKSWLTHFIAVSWFNITILILFVWFLFWRLPKVIQIIAITLSIVSFTFLVGANIPVIRASIMWLIWYYILQSWRSWDSLSLVVLTACILVLINPMILVYDISFQLSFLAVLWILYTQNFFKKLLFFVPDFWWIKEALVLTLWALVFTCPIMVMNFWVLSIIAPIANICVAWTIPLAMLWGFISILVYYVYPMWWIVFWFIPWLLLKFDIIAAHYFWNLKYATIDIDFWKYTFLVFLSYFTFIIFCILLQTEKKKEET